MRVRSTTEPPVATDADTLAVGVFADEDPAVATAPDDVAALLERGEARASAGHVAVAHLGARRLIVAGLGARDRFDGEGARRAAAAVRSRADELGTRQLAWELPAGCDADVAGGLVGGTVLGAYRFSRYRPADPVPALETLTIADADDGAHAADDADRDDRDDRDGRDDRDDRDGRDGRDEGGGRLAAAVHRAAVLAHAQNRARDLGNAPPNELTPRALAEYALALANRHPTLACEVLDEIQLRDRSMGAFGAVAQGSDQPARLITLRYDGPGAASGAPRPALVGKAVTFDSGGLNLKPGASMIDMKFDMAGGAAVIETVAALAELEAPVRLLAVVGATENMISGASMRPGDIITAYDGTTIEMNNADAEGRLVLADCITHALREGCDAIVDVATLTGGVVAALGAVHAGLMSNDDALAERLLDCGRRTGELLWRLPLHPAYAEMVAGRYAQLTNRTERREAAAITAAEFLHHFAGEHPWAHLDIAAVGDDGRAPYLGKGATGFGVRLLTELVLSFPG